MGLPLFQGSYIILAICRGLLNLSLLIAFLTLHINSISGSILILPLKATVIERKRNAHLQR